MNKLYFDLPEVVRIAEETIAAPKHRQSFFDREEGIQPYPAMVLVKDQGVYFMSSADPRPDDSLLWANAYTPHGLLLAGDERHNMEIWETARDICGGDDFAEFFKLEDGPAGFIAFARKALAATCTHLVVYVTEEAFDFGFEHH